MVTIAHLIICAVLTLTRLAPIKVVVLGVLPLALSRHVHRLDCIITQFVPAGLHRTHRVGVRLQNVSPHGTALTMLPRH